VLHLSLRSRRVVVVRRPGGARSTEYRLRPGDYLYVGSAFGPGGLASRLGRHLSIRPKTRHWDIDFLASPEVADERAAWFLPSARKDGAECRWATAISLVPGATPVTGAVGRMSARRGFGAGDCRRRCGCAAGVPDACRTHLFRVDWKPTPRRLGEWLGARLIAFGAR